MPNLVEGLRNTIRDVVPFGLSVIALILGIGPGWWFFLTLKPAEYDPTLAVLTATLIALIWTGNYTFHAVQDGRTRDQRDSVSQSS